MTDVDQSKSESDSQKIDIENALSSIMEELVSKGQCWDDVVKILNVDPSEVVSFARSSGLLLSDPDVAAFYSAAVTYQDRFSEQLHDVSEHTSVFHQRSQVEVADYVEFGHLIAQWVRDPESRPKDVGELAEQLDGIAIVNSEVKSIVFLVDDQDTVTIKLPNRAALVQRMNTIAEYHGRAKLPSFYSDYFNPGFGPLLTPLDLFLARLAEKVLG